MFCLDDLRADGSGIYLDSPVFQFLWSSDTFIQKANSVFSRGPCELSRTMTTGKPRETSAVKAAVVKKNLFF